MSDEAKRNVLEEAYANARRRFPDVAEITAEELLLRWESDDLVVVDVRESFEQQVSMIPGAITAKQFEANAAEYQGKTIVPYCTIGGRSGMYSQRLQASGWAVLNFKGSILAWTLAGGELHNSEGPTKKVHTNSKKFDLAADGYEAVW